MKKKSLTLLAAILLFGTLAFLSSGNAIPDPAKKNAPYSGLSAKEKFNAYCGSCHWQEIKTQPIAPPIFNIKRRYSRLYPGEKEFINAIVTWVSRPSDSTAKMQQAVNNFKTMPKLGYSIEDVKEIAGYIYRTDFPQPQIPDSIRQAMGGGRGQGMGMGMGQGRGKGRGNGRGWGKNRQGRGGCVNITN